MMRWSTTAFFFLLCVSASAQSSASAQTAATADTTPVSTLLQPSMESLSGTMSLLRTDKWKLSGESREQMASYVASINRDISATLPALLTAADAPHAPAGKTLEVSRNLDALYAVLLRVVSTSELSAPSQQSAALEQSIGLLRDARQSLDDRVQKNIEAQQQQVVSLQAALAKANTALAAAAAAPPPQQDCAKKTTKPRAKSTRKTAAPTTAPATTQPKPQAKP